MPRLTSCVLRPASYVLRPRLTSRRRAPSLRAAETLRYVPLRPAKQSSAAVHKYVCYAPGTGLLRAYTFYVSHAFRRFAKTAHGAGTWGAQSGGRV
ncbi:MAG: hypothetical protein LBM98_04870 [Oscillospiraceae bacterium]|nr:hypothetical protein [Oscillospiraceae bacterium]